MKLKNKTIISNKNGTSVVEFAVILPFFVFLVMAIAEYPRYLILEQKIERIAFVTSDISTQYLPSDAPNGGGITQAKINSNIFSQINNIMDPYINNANIQIALASVSKCDESGNYRGVPCAAADDIRVNWQVTTNTFNATWGSAIPNTDTISIVTGLNVDATTPAVQGTVAKFTAIKATLSTMLPSENMMVTEVFYNYEPVFQTILQNLGMPNLAKKTIVVRLYARPRNGDLITLPPFFN